MADHLAQIWRAAGQADPNRLTHPLHTYPGRMPPELVHRLLQGEEKAKVVLDPFVGSGTVLVEALAAGRQGVGVDVNPIALRITWAKTRVWDEDSLSELEERCQAISSGAFIRARKHLRVGLGLAASSQRDWYPPHVLLELQTLWNIIEEEPDPDSRELMRMFFSTLLVKVSLQRSDSDLTRVERQIGRGTTSKLFGQKATHLITMLRQLSREVPLETPDVALFQGDSRRLDAIGDEAVDLIITSPPYPGTYDYLAHQARRFSWLGEDHREAARLEVGARRQLSDDTLPPQMRWELWEKDQRAFLYAMGRVLKPGGHMYLVVGDSLLAGEPWLGDESIHDAARDVGLEPVAVASQERPFTHAEMPSAFGGRPRLEHLLCLRRPGENTHDR